MDYTALISTQFVALILITFHDLRNEGPLAEQLNLASFRRVCSMILNTLASYAFRQVFLFFLIPVLQMLNCCHQYYQHKKYYMKNTYYCLNGFDLSTRTNDLIPVYDTTVCIFFSSMM